VSIITGSKEYNIQLIKLFASFLLNMRVLLLVDEIFDTLSISKVKLIFCIDQLLLSFDELNMNSILYL